MTEVVIEVVIEAESWTTALPDVAEAARRAAERALEAPSPSQGGAAVVVLLTDDAAVRALNLAFRGEDAATNVLAFPAPASAAPHLGDVALAFGRCAREAGEQGKPLEDHVSHLVAHGVLHLLGWDHQGEPEALAMEARERDIMARLGAPDPYRDRDTLPDHG